MGQWGHHPNTNILYIHTADPLGTDVISMSIFDCHYVELSTNVNSTKHDHHHIGCRFKVG